MNSPLDSHEAQHTLELLIKASYVVLTTHDGPDGDGIGSEIGLCRALRRIGKQVKIINPEPTVRRFAFIDRDADICVWTPSLDSEIKSADLVTLIDTAELERVSPLKSALLARKEGIISIDHHPPTNNSVSGIIGSELSSTGELMFHVIRALGVSIDPDIANPLYAAILFDTDLFRYVRNDPRVFLVASELVSAGADAEGIAARMFGSVSKDYMVLTGRMLASATFDNNGRLAWAVVTPETMKGLHVDRDEVRSLVSTLSSIEGVEIAVLFKVFEKSDKVKISFRSRAPITISDIAEALGGGGHPCAAGADVKMSLEDAVSKTLQLVRNKL